MSGRKAQDLFFCNVRKNLLNFNRVHVTAVGKYVSNSEIELLSRGSKTIPILSDCYVSDDQLYLLSH